MTTKLPTVEQMLEELTDNGWFETEISAHHTDCKAIEHPEYEMVFYCQKPHQYYRMIAEAYTYTQQQKKLAACVDVLAKMNNVVDRFDARRFQREARTALSWLIFWYEIEPDTESASDDD